MFAMNGTVGRKIGNASRKYNIIPTPPGGFFAIWGVIYLGLIIAAIYCVVSNTWSLGVTIIFGIVSILNGLWICIFSLSSTRTNSLGSFVQLLMVVLNEIQWIWM